MSCPSPLLTAAQEHVLAQIANGATHTAAAASAGVHRNTVHNWLGSPAFCQALAQAQYQNACFWHDQAKALAATAIETLRALLTNPDTRDSVRLKAALAILDRVSRTPSYDDVPAPPQIHLALHNLAQGPLETKAEPGENMPALHNPAQSENELTPGPRHLTPIPGGGRPPKIGRNDLCPCGSGKKYKRCCLGKPSPAFAAAANG